MKSLHSLGAGTTWFGRQWPPGSKNYKNPSLDEIKKYIDYMVQIVPKNNRLVVDTARAYGLGESRIGEILDSERELNDKIFLCTKWGENWKINDLNNLSGAQRGTVDHSMDNLIASINFSQQNLKSFDLLYIHQATIEVMSDLSIVSEMRNRSDLIGVSISNKEVLDEALNGSLLDNFDALQVPVWLYFESFKPIASLLKDNLKLVAINSLIRSKRNRNKTPKACFQEIIKTFSLLPEENFPVILNGSRNHYKDNVNFFNQIINEGRSLKDCK